MSNQEKAPSAPQIKFSRTLSAWATNLASTGRGYKQAVSIGVDFLLAFGCLWAAYSLRHGVPFSDFRSTFYIFMLLPTVTVFVFMGMGVYRWVIRSANQRLTRQLFKGSCVASLGLLMIFYLLPADRANPRSLFIIFGLLMFVSSWGVRMLWKMLMGTDGQGEPVAIYGAGSGGQQLVSLLENNRDYRPVMFIDDNDKLGKSTLLGLPIVGGLRDDLNAQLVRREVSKVVLAMPSINSSEYHRKIQQLEKTGLPVLTMPSIDEIITGSARLDEIRDVSVNDILGRTEVTPDYALMGRRVTGRAVLVTGGGGSIGSELCRQVMKLAPRVLVVLDNCEANLYHITEELSAISQGTLGDKTPAFVTLLGSVTDKTRVKRIMSEHMINTVFHAAAYKHVPIVEAQPDQGVDVNVFGTLNVLDTAIAQGVSDFVLISTDKAVRPTNSMGASKRVAEMVLQARSNDEHKTCISMVRFGNVLGSSGSVVPKFKRQILEGGPITLTHNDVTRYFMTIPEAAQLVLHASAIAKGGDVFVLDMGEPVRISDLARTMVHLYGKKLCQETGDPDDIEVKVEGLRPGEKLYEELFISDSSQPTEVAKITTTKERWLEWSALDSRLETLAVLSANEDAVGIRNALLELAFIGEEHSGQIGKIGAMQLEEPIEGSAIEALSSVG